MSEELLRVMSEAPERELVITMTHGAYVRDAMRNFVAGPFEDDEYQPLIDEGVLIDSEKWCSVFVFNHEGGKANG
jgi:hypothetical protein